MGEKFLNRIAIDNGFKDWYELTEKNDPNSIMEYTLKALSSKEALFTKLDIIRAYQAGAIEQKDNNLGDIDVVTFSKLQEDSKKWYDRYTRDSSE